MLTKDHKGMWLKKCSDLVMDVKNKVALMKSAHGQNSVFHVFKYDIKEFFTNVVVSHVIPAVHFFLYENDKVVHNSRWVHT